MNEIFKRKLHWDNNVEFSFHKQINIKIQKTVYSIASSNVSLYRFIIK